MKRKWIALLLTAAMTISMAACGNDSGSGESASGGGKENSEFGQKQLGHRPFGGPVIEEQLRPLPVHQVNAVFYIIDPHKHFRYVFQSQESLVTIGEELKEVEAYCHIYMVRGEMPILILQEVERELLDCRVPILAIQTFVENAVKHANRPGQILSVEVAVKELEREDGLYISIRISDNGKGYPEERLEELNG